MQVLRVGSTGVEVQKWEWFLTGQGLSPGKDDGLFDEVTKAATEAFQRKWGLEVDGNVGRETLAEAIGLGFGTLDEDTNTQDQSSPGWPPKPAFKHLGDQERIKIFGDFEYKAIPTPENPERIDILGDWEQKNIVKVEIPQLIGVSGAPDSGQVRFHQLIAQQVVDLFQAWDDAGLKHLILSWGGAFNARFIRGSKTRLSNHSYGSAFDLNAQWNPLGAEPALVGKKGSIRELVPIANERGFYAGMHFTRLDGMHLEAAQIKT